MKMRMLCAALALSVLFLAGCPDKNSKLASRTAELSERVEKYQDFFAWRDFDSAARFVAPDRRADFLEFAEPLKQGFTMEDYSVRDIQIGPSGERAAVVVSRSFVLLPSVTLQKEEITQEWVIIDGDWYLSGPPY